MNDQPPEDLLRDGLLAQGLEELACRIAGRPPGPAPPDSPESGERRRLLLGAALLAGRGDVAQDAVHVASGRVHGERTPDAACREVLRMVRELRAQHP